MKQEQEYCQDTSGFYLGTTCPKCNNPFRSVIQEPKQETLEEAATNYTIDFATMSAFKLGAKWQQEQDKKCFHPLPYRLSKSDVNYECTLCGKFI